MSTILCYAQRKPGSTEPLYDMMFPGTGTPKYFALTGDELIRCHPRDHNRFSSRSYTSNQTYTGRWFGTNLGMYSSKYYWA